jgi:glycosyltransferase involved in cell wall biosynthesis
MTPLPHDPGKAFIMLVPLRDSVRYATLTHGRAADPVTTPFNWVTLDGKDHPVADATSIWDAVARRARRPRVSVVIPALNEERNLPYVASRMPHDVDEIVFVNGPSTDDTAAVARQLWPNAVHVTQSRKGKGNALACGFAAASGGIIVTIDADGSTDPAEIPRFVRALMGGADYAKGSRFIPGGGSADITTFRRVGNKGLNALVNVLLGSGFTDLCYGFNAFWRRCLDVVCLPDVDAEEAQWGDGFEVETLINIRLSASPLKVVEVFSYESNRLHGSSNLRAVTDGLRVLTIIRQELLQARADKYARSDVAYSGVPQFGPNYQLSVDDPSQQRPDNHATLVRFAKEWI